MVLNRNDFQKKINRMELADMIAMRDDHRSRVEVIRNKIKNNMMTLAQSGRSALLREKASMLTSAIAVRKAGLDKNPAFPAVGDQITIEGEFKGRGDFSSVQRVTEVGASTFSTTNGWSFFIRHDGWIAAGDEKLRAYLS